MHPLIPNALATSLEESYVLCEKLCHVVFLNLSNYMLFSIMFFSSICPLFLLWGLIRGIWENEDNFEKYEESKRECRIILELLHELFLNSYSVWENNMRGFISCWCTDNGKR